MRPPRVESSRSNEPREGRRRGTLLVASSAVALSLAVAALSASATVPSFARSITGIGDDAVAVAIGDLNGDGRADLVTADYNPEGVSVALNRGGGRFGGVAAFRVAGLAGSVAIGDLNGDSTPDVATANTDPDTVSVLLGSGDGRLGGRRDYAVGRQPVLLAIADLNADAKRDVVVAENMTSQVAVLLNRGDGG